MNLWKWFFSLGHLELLKLTITVTLSLFKDSWTGGNLLMISEISQIPSQERASDKVIMIRRVFFKDHEDRYFDNFSIISEVMVSSFLSDILKEIFLPCILGISFKKFSLCYFGLINF